jgi:hypothetical protein
MPRRRIRSLSSSPERDENGNRIRAASDVSDAGAALAVMTTHYGASGNADQTNTSGQRAPTSPAADADAALQSDVADQQITPGQRALTSPAADADAALQSRDADRHSPPDPTAEPVRTSSEKRKDATVEEARMLAELRSELRQLKEERDRREQELLERIQRFESENLAAPSAEAGNTNLYQNGGEEDASTSTEIPSKIPGPTQAPVSGSKPSAAARTSVPNKKQNQNAAKFTASEKDTSPPSPERIDVDAEAEEKDGNVRNSTSDPAEEDEGDQGERQTRKSASPPPTVKTPQVRRATPPVLQAPKAALSKDVKATAAGQTKESEHTTKSEEARRKETLAFAKQTSLPMLPPLSTGAKKPERKESGAGVCHVHPNPALRTSTQQQAAQREAQGSPREPAPPLSHPGSSKKKLTELYPKTPATHDGRVAALVNCGWRLCDSVAALEATRDEEGTEDMDAANAYLLEQHAWTVAQAQAKRDQEDDSTPITIRPGSEMAAYLNHAPDHTSTLLSMIALHSKSRASHSANSSLTAANLAAHPKVIETKESNVSLKAIARMALAVVHDCEECEAMREKAIELAKKKEQQEEEKKQRAAVKKAQTEAAKRSLEKSEQQAREQAAEAARKREEKRERERTPPLPSSEEDDDEEEDDGAFDPADAQWDKKRGRDICHGCERGYCKGIKKHVYFCEVCSSSYHLPCTSWSKLVIGPKTKAWHCGPCRIKRRGDNLPQADREQGERPPLRNQSKPGTPPPTPILDTNRRLDYDTRQTALGGGGSGGGGGGSDGGGGITPSSSRTPGTPNRSGLGEIGVKVENYLQWIPTDKSWPVDKEEDHPTQGFNRTAYRNWKSINQARSAQCDGKLGPIVNSISQGVRISVGNTILMHPEIRERIGRTNNEDIDDFTTVEDPQYLWVLSIPDDIILKHLDKHFSVTDPMPFLSMVFPKSVPEQTKDGNVNYCASTHNTFVERWLQELADLKSSGWDSSNTDLRVTYIDALSTNRTLHKEALKYKCGGSYTLLISHMREWTQTNTAKQLAEAAQRKLLNENGSVHHEQHFAASNTTPAATPKNSAAGKPFTDAKASALMTEMSQMRTEMSKLKSKMHPLEAMSQAKGPNTWQARNPSHIDANKEFFCNGCGHTYQKDGRRIACLPNCVYSEHPHHNSNYKNAVSGAATPYPTGQAKLEWGTPESYLKQFKKEMPERAKRYVASRAANATKRAKQSDKSDGDT